MRIKTKIVKFTVPDSPEKYLSLKVNTKVVKNGEFQEDSELMEDLYKIIPLTVETLFDEVSKVINCQFDSVNDLRTAENILELVLSPHTKQDLNPTTAAGMPVKNKKASAAKAAQS